MAVSRHRVRRADLAMSRSPSCSRHRILPYPAAPVEHIAEAGRLTGSTQFGTVEDMRIRHAALVPLAALAICLTACTARAEPDLRAAEEQASEFAAQAEAGNAFLGAGSLSLNSQDTAPSDDEGVTLTYPSEMRVDEVRVACFGEGKVSFGYAVRIDSSWLGDESVDVACDGVENVLTPLEPFEDVTAVNLNGILVEGPGAVLVAVVSGAGEPGESTP